MQTILKEETKSIMIFLILANWKRKMESWSIGYFHKNKKPQNNTFNEQKQWLCLSRMCVLNLCAFSAVLLRKMTCSEQIGYFDDGKFLVMMASSLRGQTDTLIIICDLKWTAKLAVSPQKAGTANDERA